MSAYTECGMRVRQHNDRAVLRDTQGRVVEYMRAKRKKRNKQKNQQQTTTPTTMSRCATYPLRLRSGTKVVKKKKERVATTKEKKADGANERILLAAQEDIYNCWRMRCRFRSLALLVCYTPSQRREAWVVSPTGFR